MTQFDILQEKILNYFPPVIVNILNIYEETMTSYNTYFAIIPLKHLNNKDIYAPEILKTLQSLRILLRSNLSKSRFVYELNLLNSSWGKDGYYQKSILKQELVDLIKKINIVFLNEEKEKQYEIMKYAEELSLNYKLNDINNDLLNLKLNKNFTKIPNKSRSSISKNKKLKKNIVSKEYDLDLSNLKIN